MCSQPGFVFHFICTAIHYYIIINKKKPTYFVKEISSLKFWIFSCMLNFCAIHICSLLKYIYVHNLQTVLKDDKRGV